MTTTTDTIKEFRKLWGSYHKHKDTEGLDVKIEQFLLSALSKTREETLQEVEKKIESHVIPASDIDKIKKNMREGWVKDNLLHAVAHCNRLLEDFLASLKEKQIKV